VVARCRRGPAEPIHSRDDWKCSARGPLDDGSPLDTVPELVDEEEEGGADEEDGRVDAPEVTEDTAAGAEPELLPLPAGAGTDTADVTVDTACVTIGGGGGAGGGVGTVGTGRGGVGTGTGAVTVGTGGIGGGGGSKPAAAPPARRAAPTMTATQVRTRIPG
jgi:hypothetical protein